MPPRTCPHCKKIIPLDHGFHFDEKLNLLHDECSKPVFATESSLDGTLTAAAVANRSSYYRTNHYDANSNYNGYNQHHAQTHPYKEYPQDDYS